MPEYATRQASRSERRLRRRNPVLGGGTEERAERATTVGRGATPPSELELVAERDQRQVDGVAEGVTLPRLVGHLPRVLQIVPEDLGHPRRHRLVEEGDVQLVVELERAVVEVGAADGDPPAVTTIVLACRSAGPYS